MTKTSHMEIVLKLPGASYDTATAPYNSLFRPYVDRMDAALAAGGALAQLPIFADYAVYCRWPIRQLEYSFVIRNLPDQADGPLLDVGSGVTPWPFVVAARGWPTTSIDPEVDQMIAMKRAGQDVFDATVDYRVGDARGLGFASETFAAVTCVSVLEHLQHADVPLALAEIVRVCRPGGRIILTTDIYAGDDPLIPSGQGAFPASTLERIFSPFARACGVEHEFATLIDAHRQLSLGDLDEFWQAHWRPGLWQKENRRYGAIGLVFDLPESPAACRALVDALRVVAGQIDFPSGDVYHRVPTPDGTQLWMIDDEVMSQEAASESFEQDIRAFFEHLLRPGDVVFDVGANVGLHTLQFSRMVGPQGQVHAFEPTDRIFGCLARNALAVEPNLRLNRFALSHENGALALHYGAQGNACFNSFGEPIADGSSQTGEYETETVYTTTLDDYMHDYAVERLDLLKVDVEGWEERVLRGGIGTLVARAPILALEFCSPAARNADSSCGAIARLVESLGYDLFRYQPATRTLQAVEAGRDAWEYANLIGIHRVALQHTLDRLNGSAATAAALQQPALAAPGGHGASDHDVLHLLIENRSLHQRLASGILDREVTTLHQRLQILEADRAERLNVIQRLDAELSHTYTALAESEADRDARLRLIQQLDTHLKASEDDRAARLEVIQSLQQQLAAAAAELSAAGTQLELSVSASKAIEADSVARLDVIRAQQNLLNRPIFRVLRRLHLI